MIDMRARQGRVQEVETPTGIRVGVGAVDVVIAGLVAAAIPAAYPGGRFAVLAAMVGLFAAVTCDEMALAFVAIIAFAVFDGFLENRFGQLSWHGSSDLWRLLLLVITAGCGLAIGEGYRHATELRVCWRIESAVDEAIERAPSEGVTTARTNEAPTAAADKPA